MNWGGWLALTGLALFCIILSLTTEWRGRLRLPGGWAAGSSEARAAAGFLRLYLRALAAALLLAPVAIQKLPWRLTAVLLGSCGLLALIGAGLGVVQWGSNRHSECRASRP